MRSTWLRLKRIVKDEAGNAYVEYVVLSAVAVLVILAAVQFFFGSIAALFQRIAQSLLGVG
jgi:Flp pilus assembly pilin Flp